MPDGIKLEESRTQGPKDKGKELGDGPHAGKKRPFLLSRKGGKEKGGGEG